MPELFRFPLLHAGGSDPTGWLWSDWNIEPTIAVGLLALVAGYLFLTKSAHPSSSTLLPSIEPSPPTPPPVEPGEGAFLPSPRSRGEGLGMRGRAAWGRVGGEGKVARTVTGRQKAAFIGGAVTLFLALGPPLDDWSDHYLLLAHMIQHLLLVMLAAPLLLIGAPAWVLEPLTRNRITNAAGYWLTRPVVAYTLANAVFVLWHVPVFYEAALRSQPVHVFEHATMLGAGILAWWPIVGPLPQWPRLPLAVQSLYFFAMTLPGSAAGAFITFANPGLYAPYDTADRIFGIDLATDQQLAGLVMWVAVSSIYLLLITVSFFRWASREEAADAAAARLEHPPASVSAAPAETGARATS